MNKTTMLSEPHAVAQERGISELEALALWEVIDVCRSYYTLRSSVTGYVMTAFPDMVDAATLG